MTTCVQTLIPPPEHPLLYEQYYPSGLGLFAGGFAIGNSGMNSTTYLLDGPELSSIEVLRNGSLFLGCTMTSFLLGGLIVQIYHFSSPRDFETDPLFTRIAVWVVVIFDFFKSICIIYTVWWFLVAGTVKVDIYPGAAKLGWMNPPLSGLESAIVQIYFAWRIWRFRRESILSRVVAAIIVAASITQCSGAICKGINLARRRDADTWESMDKIFTQVWLISSLICDFIIVCGMSLLLIQARRNSSFANTERMIDRLMLITVESGLVTMIAVTTQVIFYLMVPENGVQLGIMYIIGGLYANVFLTVLNARRGTRRVGEQISTSIHIPNSILGNPDESRVVDHERSEVGG
ncbi:hypothetical protein BDQ12DRAFT_737534, partial [Crucibulum laeve]